MLKAELFRSQLHEEITITLPTRSFQDLKGEELAEKLQEILNGFTKFNEKATASG